jgi:ribosomal protein S21
MQILVRENNVDQALRALKKKLQREGVYREMKLRRHLRSPRKSAPAKRLLLCAAPASWSASVRSVTAPGAGDVARARPNQRFRRSGRFPGGQGGGFLACLLVRGIFRQFHGVQDLAALAQAGAPEGAAKFWRGRPLHRIRSGWHDDRDHPRSPRWPRVRSKLWLGAMAGHCVRRGGGGAAGRRWSM